MQWTNLWPFFSKKFFFLPLENSLSALSCATYMSSPSVSPCVKLQKYRRISKSKSLTIKSKNTTIPATLIRVIGVINLSFESVNPELDILFVLPFSVDLSDGNGAKIVTLTQNSLRFKTRRVFVNQFCASLVYFHDLQRVEWFGVSVWFCVW